MYSTTSNSTLLRVDRVYHAQERYSSYRAKSHNKDTHNEGATAVHIEFAKERDLFFMLIIRRLSWVYSTTLTDDDLHLWSASVSGSASCNNIATGLEERERGQIVGVAWR